MHHDTIATASTIDLERPDLYINRELSWIEFNRRVFQEAQDSRHPLLERIKFLSIFDSNLDEFLMIRVAGFKEQIDAHVTSLSPDGLMAEQQLIAVRQRLEPLMRDVHTCWRNELCPMLAAKHIFLLEYEQL